MLKKQRYNVMLNPRSMDILDGYCRTADISRSSLIDGLILDFINDEGLLLEHFEKDIEGQEVFET
ncbi:MAG: hypothetical protein NC084_00065 [Bacteroides sp.]|nr:hypothetical protein [Eubacterium sp.]MCM1417299.1 hypothetical protein [Roseburia sp.]MCM1461081.1 hypothetical protein [Bacteroides sp.]